MTKAPRALAGALLLGTLCVPGLAAAAADSAVAATVADSALTEGNRLFQAGELERAYEAYAAGIDPARPDPLLAYNLGTTAHHLDRLPEAVLWYRRAAAGSPPDAWLADNLALARRDLGTRPTRPPLAAALRAHHRGFALAGVVLAWAALPLMLARRTPGRGPGWRWAGAVLALLACAAFGAGRLAAVRGPRPAVLLARCGALAAGSEVWVDAAPAGGWRVSSGRAVCPAAGVGLVEP
jgi:tetratricopeptide (TPR) repeat protein